MVSGETILAAIQKGNFSGRSAEIAEYLQREETSKEVRQKCLHAINYLYFFTTDYDKLPDSEFPGVFEAVEHCSNFIQTKSKQAKDAQTSQKLLFHILSKTIKKGFLSESVRLARCLHGFLFVPGSQEDPAVRKVAQSTFATLWNAAIHREKDAQADPQLCLKLRHWALAHLLLSDKATEIGEEVITWTINHYGRVLSKHGREQANTGGSASSASVCSTMVEMVKEMANAIWFRLEPENIDNDTVRTFVMTFIEMQIHLLLFLLKNEGYALCQKTVSNIQDLLTGLSGKLSSKENHLGKNEATIVCILEVGVLLGSHLKQYNVGSTTPKLAAALGKASSRLSLVLKQKPSLLLMRLTHSVLAFCLQLPEEGDSGRFSKIDIQNVPVSCQKPLRQFFSTVLEFYEMASEPLAKSNNKKLLGSLHFVRTKVLQSRLGSVLSQLDDTKDLKSSSARYQLSSASKDIADLVHLLNEQSERKEQSVNDDLYSLATLSYKFGRMCYLRGLHKRAAEFMEPCISQFQQWVKVAPQEKHSSVNLGKKFEMLADCQRRAGRTDCALSTLAACCRADPSHLTGAADLWVKVKGDIARADPEGINLRSLWSYVKESPNTLSAVEVLHAELSAYKKTRSRSPDLTFAIVEELLAEPSTKPEDRATVLIDKAQLLWTNRTEGSGTAEECCQEAVRLLEVALADEKSVNPFLQDDLARAYLLCHLVADVDPLQLREEMTKSKPKTKPDLPFEEEPEEDETFHDCCTVYMEHLANDMADKALQLWEEVIAVDKGDGRIRSLPTTIKCLTALADRYHLSSLVAEEFRTLKILLVLCTANGQHAHRLETVTGLVRLYLDLHQPHLALQVIEESDSWLADVTTPSRPDNGGISTAQQVLYLIAKAEAYLLAGQVRESCSTLHEATEMKVQNFRSNSTDALRLEGPLYRLTARLSTLPPEYHHTAHKDCCLLTEQDSGLELQVKGARSISGVVCFFMGEWLLRRKETSGKVPTNTLNKWALLDELLTSLYSTGATCVRLGEARDAKCYLNQGLKLAQAFHIPRRFAAFHLELSHLDSLSAKFNDSQSHINVTSYILSWANIPQPPLQSRTVSKLNEQCKNNSEQTASQEDDVFDDEIIIKTRVIDMPEMLQEEDPREKTVGSPTSCSQKPKPPVSWTHPAECPCCHCVDIAGQGLQLMHLAQQAFCLYQQGLTSQAESFWQLLLQNFDAVTNRVRHTLLNILPQAHDTQQEGNGTEKESSTSKSSNKTRRSRGKKVEKNVKDDQEINLKPVMFQKLLVEVCKYLTELAISKQNWDLYEQWVAKAEELLDAKTYPWMLQHHQILAEVLYLKMVPSLPWPQVTEKTDLEELCDRIGRAKSVPKIKLFECSSESSGESFNEQAQSCIAPVEPECADSENKEDEGKKDEKLSRRGSRSQLTRLSSTADVAKQVNDTSEKSSNHDVGTVSKANSVKNNYKTPARKMKARSTAVSTPKTTTDLPEEEYLKVFKSQKRVTGRRAVLDMLINSDSDEDILKSVKSTVKNKPSDSTKPPASTRRTYQRKKDTVLNTAPKTLPTPKVKLDLISPSNRNKMNASQKINQNIKLLSESNAYNTPQKRKSPVSQLFKAALNKSVAMEMGSENVYDFIPSSPEETPLAARGKKKPGKPGRKPAAVRGQRASSRKIAAEEPEMKRTAVVQDQADPMESAELITKETLGTNRCVPTPRKSTPARTLKPNTPGTETGSTTKRGCRHKSTQLLEDLPKRPTRSSRTTKLTRSQTAVLETHREAESPTHWSSLNFDSSEFMPVEEVFVEDTQGDDVYIDHVLSPDHSFQSGEQHTVPRCNSDSEVNTSSRLSAEHLSNTVGSGVLKDAVPSEEDVHIGSQPLPGHWLMDPIEVMRGYSSDEEESTTKSKSRQRASDSRSRRKCVDDVREVPRTSKISQSGEGRAKTEDKETTGGPLLRKPPSDSSDLQAHLDQAFNLMRHHPPLLPYRQVCHAQVVLGLAADKPDPWKLAFHLTESQSVSFRHDVLGNISRKIKKQLEATGTGGEDSSGQVARLRNMQTALAFGSTVDDLKQTVNGLPEDWTVVQVSVLTAVGERRGRMVMTRFVSGQAPIVLHLPGYSTSQGQAVLDKFSNILKSNNATMQVTNKVEWWSQRHSIDEKLKELLEELEGRWLGCWQGALLGRPENDDDEDRLQQAARQLADYVRQTASRQEPVDEQLVKLLLRSHHLLDERQVTLALCQLSGLDAESDITAQLIAKTNGVAKTLNLALCTKCRPVLLILDKAVQHFPWESLPSLRGQCVSRLPSIHFLHAHLGALRADADSVLNCGIDRRKTFYVLNPDDNLESTQMTFEENFKKEPGWKGIVGKPPTISEFSKALTERDLFIYCGHGSGSKFVPGMTLPSLHCRATVMLMGCSSGRLTVDGQLEAAGMMLNYFLAGCPCIVACLWDVTDRDIDRFVSELLTRWKQAEPGSSFLDCVHQSRHVCRLPYLIGAAPAVYGLPVFAKKTEE